MADNGNFQINDIVFSIPPEAIQVRRQSVHFETGTLRTRSSIKVKTGFSQIDMTIKAVFTDNLEPSKLGQEVNGLTKLRDLVSQIRVTPICYVENDYLRNTIIAGNTTRNMAIIVKELMIEKDNQGDVNVLNVTIEASWFNYAPFSKSFTYRKEIFGLEEVNDPAESNAWKLLYQAEQQRNPYATVLKLIDSDFSVQYSEYSSVTIKQYKFVQTQNTLLQKLKQELETLAGDSSPTPTARLGKALNKAIDDQEFNKTKTSDLLGNTSTMGQDLAENDVADSVAETLSGAATTDALFQSLNGMLAAFSDWKPVLMKDNKPLVFKGNLSSQPNYKDYSSNDQILLRRRRSVDFGASNIVIASVKVSFRNITAVVPLIGHQYPTYQHLGSIDGTVIIDFTTTSEGGIRTLSNLYTSIEDQAMKYRMIPGGLRNLVVTNNIVNMCGMHDMMPDYMELQTAEGMPGTTNGRLVLLDNPINADTQEKISPGIGFFSNQTVRQQVAAVLDKYVILSKDAFIQGAPLGGGSFKEWFHSLTSSTHNGEKVPSIVLNRAFVERTGQSAEDSMVFYNATYRDGIRNEAVNRLVKEYARHLSLFLSSTVRALNATPSALPKFNLLTNDDVVSVERIRSDAKPVIDQISKFNAVAQPTTTKTDATAAADKANNAQETAALQGGVDPTYLIEDNPLEAILNACLTEWVNWSSQFLDHILLSSLIELPEFASALDMLKESTIKANSDCYPDFPIADVISLTKTAAPSAYSKLETLFKKSNLALSNVGLVSLVNPDFYFYNPTFDNIDNILTPQMIKTAADGVSAGRKAMVEEEMDWFKGVYEKSIIGMEKTRKIAEQVADESRDIHFFKDNPLVESFRSQRAQSFKGGFAPNELQDSVPPTIAASAGDSKFPIIFNSQDQARDRDNIGNNYVYGKFTMIPAKDAISVQHRYETDDVLYPLSEASYQGPNQSVELKDAPRFVFPTNSICRRIISRFGPRTAPQTPLGDGSSFHRGLDLGGASPDISEGSDVLASAAGTISLVSYSATETSKGTPMGHAGNEIHIQHANGYLTKYFHLQWGPDIQYLSDVFHNKGGAQFVSTDVRSIALTVTAGQRIASIGHTGGAEGPHLHFEVWKNGTAVNPLDVLQGTTVPSKGPIRGIDTTNDSILSKSADALLKDISSHQGYGMIRAYPTFKLYFIESDLGERRRFSFDDFFSYSSVQEIEVIRSRKIASDLCKIRLTNISGVLSNRKFVNALDPTKAYDDDGNIVKEQPKDKRLTNTMAENPVASLMLQPGIQVQLRLGYSNNPEELEVVFNGQIQEVLYGDSDELVEIVCQSYATELVQEVIGDVKKFGGILDASGLTGNIIEELLSSPEVVHYGRWEFGDFGGNSQRGLLTTRWTVKPQPQDDNVWAPERKPGFWARFQGTAKYVVYRSTIWDVLQEMTLRHPSYIVSSVPYQGKYGPRMTLFFGLPDQLYFARDATFEEDSVANALKQVIVDGVDPTDQARDDVRNPMQKVSADTYEQATAGEVAKRSDDEKEQYFKRLAKQYALDKGFIRPFRNYHVATSTLHIVENNIHAAGWNTFNTVTIQHSDGTPKADTDTGELNFNSSDTFTLKADAGIPDEQTREILLQYPNCNGYEQAKQYALSSLFYALKEAYRGELIMTGNAKIKPFDIIYIFDEYTDMYGAIEVEQVIHKFNQQTGFLTEVTPDLIVHVNQHATLSTSDGMGLLAEGALRGIGMESAADLNFFTSPNSTETNVELAVGAGLVAFGAAAAGITFGSVLLPALAVGLAANAVFTPLSYAFFNSSENAVSVDGNHSLFGLLGTFVFRKLITRTQLAHPLRYSPLTLQGKPLIGGLPNRYTDGNFFSPVGRWFKEAASAAPLWVEDAHDRMKLNNWFNPQGDFF